MSKNITENHGKSSFFNSKSFFWLVVILLVGSFIFVWLFEFLNATLCALVLYTLNLPFYEAIKKKTKWSDTAAALTVIFTSFFAVVLPIIGVCYLFIDKLNTMIQSTDTLLNQAKILLTKAENMLQVSFITDENKVALSSQVTKIATELLKSTIDIIDDVVLMNLMLFFLLVSNRFIIK